jgi:excisionase family DNA binding protein
VIHKEESGALVLNGHIGRRLLNVRETARYLDLDEDTVYRKARLRELPCVKVGRALRFDLEALRRFIDEHTLDAID